MIQNRFCCGFHFAELTQDTNTVAWNPFEKGALFIMEERVSGYKAVNICTMSHSYILRQQLNLMTFDYYDFGCSTTELQQTQEARPYNKLG